MSLTCRFLFRSCNHITIITKPLKWNVGKVNSLRPLSSGMCYSRHNTFYNAHYETKRLDLTLVRNHVTQSSSCDPGKPVQDPDNKKSQEPEKKVGIIQKFKIMYRDYWYVLLPVHMCTSAVWLGGFYYLVRSGVDVIGILESYGVSESLLEPLKKSGAGYVALTFALYKLATPLRYAVTVGGTTYTIRRLTAIGWIKPVPSGQRIKEMIQEKKDNFQDRFNESKQHYQDTIKARRTQVMDEMRKYKMEMKRMKNKVRRM